MSLSELNPWGFTAVAATIVSLSFAYFLWKKAVPTPVTRRFIVLLLIEIVTMLTSVSGIYLLFNGNVPESAGLPVDIIHHLGDFLMLVLYPIFVAYALPIKFLKPLTTPKGRHSAYAFTFLVMVVFMLIHFGVIESDAPVDMWLYEALVVMFIAVFFVSLFAVGQAKTKLARERAIAFVLAFGFRDLAWATVYLSVVTGWVEKVPILIDQLYIGPTLIYIPIMAYGILKLQMLDIEIRLKTTIKNSVLAGMFLAFFFLISEGSNEYLSNQLGGIIGFGVSALLTLFLTPLHKWAERFSSKLVGSDIDDADYPESRSLQMYSTAVEETQAYGEITPAQISLLERLRESLNVSPDDAARLEQNLNFNRVAVQG